MVKAFLFKDAGPFTFNLRLTTPEHGTDFMADWLKIPSKKKRREEDIPEPYEIVCVCGVSLSGYRRKTPFRHACQQCDEVYFILPRNSYPAPKARKKKKQVPASQQFAELILNTPFMAKLKEKRKQKQAAAQKAGEAAAKATTKPKVSPFELPPPRTKLITPFRGILAGIVLIVGLTAYGILHSRKLDQASETLKTATIAGEDLLKQGDLPGANNAYLDAFHALNVLGRTDQRANEIRQTSLELQAINSQAVSPLFEIADEAVTKIKQSDAESWESLFDVRYAGTWMIFEASLVPLAEDPETQEPRYRLNFPVLLDEYTLYLELTSPSFLEYLKRHPGQPLIFAAQMKGFQQEADQSDTGIIELDGKTTFLWSHLDLYEQLGIQFDEFHNREHIERLLTQQTQFLGLSK
ncbi:hypothetical protein [Gimesia fumaroli]|jgi:hypothetical protein|uniref:Uncharacterized protein n=1 Tax=Gimesia fumaroli TaxID=2527976 RepID=A0A518I727_9PLAN|nr:hypothetical protein [Gimesia fumaroli]QDV48895.1 hypothetical protein Enr17x_09100 [Gimesia fumaroli]